MPLDPYQLPTSGDEAAQLRIAELERRVTALERATKSQAVTAPPAAPGVVGTLARGGEVINLLTTAPAGGSVVVDRSAGRTYFFDGSVWKYVAIT